MAAAESGAFYSQKGHFRNALAGPGAFFLPQGFFPERAVGINHVAIGYPTREEWLARIRHLRDNGVEFAIRGNHGMTHSAYISDPDGNGIEVLYELPAEVWEGDVDAALNYFEMLPNDSVDHACDDEVTIPKSRSEDVVVTHFMNG